MYIENITKELREILHPNDENPTGLALFGLVEDFSIEIVRIDGKHYASYNDSDTLTDQLQEIADSATISLDELEGALCERYYIKDDDREGPEIVGYPRSVH